MSECRLCPRRCGTDRALHPGVCGTEEEILTEEEIVIDGATYVAGNTREYVRCAAPAGTSVNTLVRGTVTGFLTEDLMLLEP